MTPLIIPFPFHSFIADLEVAEDRELLRLFCEFRDEVRAADVIFFPLSSSIYPSLAFSSTSVSDILFHSLSFVFISDLALVAVADSERK